MKKILIALLALGLMMTFVGCKEDSAPPMNEDYAGTWYDNSLNVEIDKFDLTDTTFEISYKDTGKSSYTPNKKGTLVKVSDGIVTMVVTHAYASANSDFDEGWYSAAEAIEMGVSEHIFEPENVTYTLSADGTELTWDGLVLTSVEP